jgi:hypothetical protein
MEDKEECDLIKTMLADISNHMQECKDYIKTVKLNNPQPFYDPCQEEHFTNQVWVLLDCHLTHQEEFTIQLKNITQGEWTWKQAQDQWNCTWNGYMKTLTLSFTWVDAAGEIWSLKLVLNSHVKAGNFLDKVYKLMLMLMRMKRSMELLIHAQCQH